MAPPTGRSSGVRLSELVAVLSFSSDFGLGQPMEHVLRSCLIALRLADRLGLDEPRRRETFWVTLLATVCTGESFELAQLFGNEVAFRSGIYHVGPSQLAQMVHALGRAGANRPPPGRMRAAAGILASRGKTVEARFLAHCALTSDISHRFGLDPAVGEALSNTFVRWDGKGIPRGVSAQERAAVGPADAARRLRRGARPAARRRGGDRVGAQPLRQAVRARPRPCSSRPTPRTSSPTSTIGPGTG